MPCSVAERNGHNYDKGENKIQFIYNGIVPVGASDSLTYARMVGFTTTTTGTNSLKTQVIRVNDAALRSSGHSSGSSFGIIVPAGAETGDVAIKSIRLIQSDIYD